MRMRTLTSAALAAAALMIGGGAAAYATTPEPKPIPSPTGTPQVFTCKDGVVTLEEAEPGTYFRTERIKPGAEPHVDFSAPGDVLAAPTIETFEAPDGVSFATPAAPSAPGVDITVDVDGIVVAVPHAGASCASAEHATPAEPHK